MENLILGFVISFVVVFCIVIFTTYWIHYRKYKKIDVVYTWVTYDDRLRDEIYKLKGEEKNDNSNPNRYITNDELKYSLRSLETFADWIHKIYIVVHDHQRPSWLQETKKLKIIKHSDIIPLKYLPTYNSLCIESFLYRIPNLTEKYIYFNDDLLLWNYVIPDTFFYKNKTLETNAVSFHTYKNRNNFEVDINDKLISVPKEEYEFEKLIIFNGNLISKYLNQPVDDLTSVEHVPFGNRKSLNKKLDKFLDTIPYENTNLNEHTKMSKFRQNTNIAQVSIFRKYWYSTKNASLPSSSKVYYLTIKNLKKELVEKLLSSDVHFVCIQNDINYDKDECQDQRDLMLKLLEKKFPRPSSFEK